MNCTICCDELKKNQAKLACGHTFHNNCLIRWLIDHDTCPICRYEINPKNNPFDILNEAHEEDNEVKIYLNHIWSTDILDCMFNFAIDSINLNDEYWTIDYANEFDFKYINGIFQKKVNGNLTRVHLYVKNWNNTYVVYCSLIEILIPKSYYYKKSSHCNYKSNHKCNKYNKIRNQNYFRKRPKVY